MPERSCQSAKTYRRSRMLSASRPSSARSSFQNRKMSEMGFALSLPGNTQGEPPCLGIARKISCASGDNHILRCEAVPFRGTSRTPSCIKRFSQRARSISFLCAPVSNMREMALASSLGLRFSALRSWKMYSRFRVGHCVFFTRLEWMSRVGDSLKKPFFTARLKIFLSTCRRRLHVEVAHLCLS